MGSVDALWSLGDMVGYGPQPNECIEALTRFPHLNVPGNHDWGMLGRLPTSEFNIEARTVLEWTQRVLTPSHLDYMQSLAVSVTPEEPSFTLVHASPRDPMWEYLLDLFDAAECFPLFRTRYLLVGHTHVPIIFRDSGGIVKATIPEPDEKIRINARMLAPTAHPSENGARMIINPGSVGQPRDGDPRAAYAVLDLADDTGDKQWNAALTFRRIPYDIEETQALMKDLNFPKRLIARLALGL